MKKKTKIKKPKFSSESEGVPVIEISITSERVSIYKSGSKYYLVAHDCRSQLLTKKQMTEVLAEFL